MTCKVLIDCVRCREGVQKHWLLMRMQREMHLLMLCHLAPASADSFVSLSFRSWRGSARWNACERQECAGSTASVRHTNISPIFCGDEICILKHNMAVYRVPIGL